MEFLTVAVPIERLLVRLDAIAVGLQEAAAEAAGLAEADLEHATALRP